jgi:hypothetical protein
LSLIFRVKNRVTCDLRVCEGLPGIFKKMTFLRWCAAPFSPGWYYLLTGIFKKN